MNDRFTSDMFSKYMQVEYVIDCTDTSKLKDAIAEINIISVCSGDFSR
ncbi:MAG: hypothetical protein WC139_00015 [Candidatus Kapaibacterium sp.]